MVSNFKDIFEEDRIHVVLAVRELTFKKGENKMAIPYECEECGAEFHVEHEMGLQYLPHYCPFCGEQLPDDEVVKIEEEELLHWKTININISQLLD